MLNLRAADAVVADDEFEGSVADGRADVDARRSRVLHGVGRRLGYYEEVRGGLHVRGQTRHTTCSDTTHDM